ncbi:purine-binding chemotaxis protein [Roseovarius sp. THAF27]|uniref:chemotaxis protein CheW n=1 Tax=Roseovarius sp. THAF27 TaxID=2587850 RepID=UPI0012A84B93|nr:chemotaxis protein CheW [Roseovarius sp. THAF27]QFT80259.1 purine-binding chemotaxis protein [Roseovarius sp. THAF27]
MSHPPETPPNATARGGPAPIPGASCKADAPAAAMETAPGVHAARNVVYGSFWLDETEFALPVDVIQEVVNAPDSYSEVPLAAPHMVGLFCLRNTIVPVIDLRHILGIAPASETSVRKVAIIENGDLCVGLLFDDTGAIIQGMNATRVNFLRDAQGLKDIIVEGVLKLDDGARMVQLLDPYEILQIEKIPRVARIDHAQQRKTHLGQRFNCISFQLGHTTCALDLRFVQEITDMPPLQTSQLAHGYVIGNVELRGRTLPVVDFRGMIGNETPYKFKAGMLEKRKLLVLDLPAGRIGLLVYSIDSIMTFYEKDILPFANVGLPRHDVVSGCLVRQDETIVILLDHHSLLKDEMLALAARSCQEIYPSTDVETKPKNFRTERGRSTFILFSVDIEMGFDISGVNEVIDRPSSLLKPPYALAFVDGILNLRGELITLINLRVLYGFPETGAQAHKVLIFENGGRKYGITVDSIDEIVTTGPEDLFEVPTIRDPEAARLVSGDLAGCLRVPSRPSHSNPVLVLDQASVVRRCIADARFEAAAPDVATET